MADELRVGLEALRALPAGAVVTIGNFDGVHRGHRELLRRARAVAGTGGGAGRVVAVTFDPHPAAVLRPEAAPQRLTPLPLKVRLLREAGADDVVVLPPVRELLEIEAEDFFAILRDETRASHLVEGDNFCFGRGRRGTIERLGEWTRAAGMGLTVLGPVEVALLDLTVVPVSSSLIRFLVACGRVRDAGICLGGPVRLTGTVVEGFKRGRTIGFPTANLDVDDGVTPPVCVPMDGVYAGRTTIDGRTYPIALNVGPLPTFSDTARQIEAHVIGFGGDLYGRRIELELLDYVRDQRKFAGIDGLKAQLAKDVVTATERAGRARLLEPIGML